MVVTTAIGYAPHQPRFYQPFLMILFKYTPTTIHGKLYIFYFYELHDKYKMLKNWSCD